MTVESVGRDYTGVVEFIGPGCWSWSVLRYHGIAATREQAIERMHDAAGVERSSECPRCGETGEIHD